MSTAQHTQLACAHRADWKPVPPYCQRVHDRKPLSTAKPGGPDRVP